MDNFPIEAPDVLSKKLPFKRIYYKSIQRGTLISCQYLFWKHDPYPLVLVTDVTGDMIRGINLHYLTYRYVADMLGKYCDERLLSYGLIKNDRFIVNAFRSYKKEGLRLVKQLDCEVIKQIMGMSTTFKPSEMKMIKNHIREQLQKQMNPKAEDIASQYSQQLSPGKLGGFQQLDTSLRPHGTQKPMLGSPPNVADLGN